jgi:hypothetical protein
MITLGIIVFLVIPIRALYNYYWDKKQEKWHQENPDMPWSD